MFERPVYFRQEADELNFGALSAPWVVDWDGDRRLDLIVNGINAHIMRNLGAEDGYFYLLKRN